MTKYNDNAKRSEKQHWREELLRQMGKLECKRFRYIGLPGLTWPFEKQLLKKFPHARVDGVERDPRRFVTMQANCPAGCQAFEGDIQAWMCLQGLKYDAIWLDLCSPWTEKIEQVIYRASEAAGHILAVTLMGAREPKGHFKGRMSRVAHINTRLAALEDRGWQAEGCFPYRDTQCPMFMYIFTKDLA